MNRKTKRILKKIVEFMFITITTLIVGYFAITIPLGLYKYLDTYIEKWQFFALEIALYIVISWITLLVFSTKKDKREQRKILRHYEDDKKQQQTETINLLYNRIIIKEVLSNDAIL